MGNKDEKRGFAKGAVLGGILGGIGALLFAPKSGKETRADIASGVRKVSDEVVSQLKRTQGDLSAKLAEVKAASKDLKGEAAEEASLLAKKAEALRDDLRVATSNIVDASADVRDEVAENARVLLKSSREVLKELEAFSRKMAASAKDKAKSVAGK